MMFRSLLTPVDFYPIKITEYRLEGEAFQLLTWMEWTTTLSMQELNITAWKILMEI